VFIPSDLELGKVLGTLIYNPTLMAVKGNYDQVNRLCSEVANTYGWGFVNINLRPYYSEGSKTLGYEVIEQLGWQLPDHIVAPLASGSLFGKIRKGFDEFIKWGWSTKSRCASSGAQAEGCSPIAQAFAEGRDYITPVKPNTIAKSIAIGNPPMAPIALDIARRSNGSIAAVSDDEIVAGIQLLAETKGCSPKPPAAPQSRCSRSWWSRGKIDPAKPPSPTSPATASRPSKRSARWLGEPYTIEPQLASFNAAWERAQSLQRASWEPMGV